MVWAAPTASRMARTVHSMLETTPLRSPRQGTLPTPSTVIPSPSTSPTTAETLVVPRSSPTTISGEFSLFVATISLVLAGCWLTRLTLTRAVARGQLSCKRSAHADDDALGMQRIVEKNHAR